MIFGRLTSAILAVGLAAFATGANAATVLDSGISCNDGTPLNGISITDVTGTTGGADNCWGTYNGNDNLDQPFTIGSTTFSFLSKVNISDSGGMTHEGADIGLTVSAGTSGTWSFGASLDTDFLIVLKAANSPGYAIWSFFGANNDETSGDWLVAWLNNGGQTPNLSHLAVYAAPSAPIPLPAAGWLLISGLGGLGVVSRRKRRAS